MISTQDSQLVLKSTNDSTWRVVHEHRVPFGSVHHRFVLAELDTRIAAQHPELPVPQQSSILKISLYCAEMACLQATRARLAGVYDLPLAAIECVAQPYHGSGELAALIWVIEGEQVGRLRQGACHILRQPELEWAIAGWQSESHAEYALEALTESAFQSVEADLRAAGFGFAQWVRTWIYIGQIEGGEPAFGHYQDVNRGRKNAFNHWSAHRYPASTGIGSLSGLGLTSLAVASACATVIPVENRYQTSAWSYPSAISTSAPLFSRGMAVQIEDQALVLISGTASIIDSESVHPGDIKGQVQQTFSNVAAVIRGANQALNDDAAALQLLCSCVVYVKTEGLLPAVKALCSEHLPRGIPVVYSVAHVCRDELLVEIEGVAIVRAAQVPS